ncbi:hypothetical protein MZD75_12690 [Escherichia coli]|uniref:hypothetical protein n=1 Tax=Escherichia coli TaxID=562 RepID=UPI001FCE7F33|nr:hypothetical protein [Escherichia coli]MCK2325984.1 hypothetical protein [Escherichia coli]
MITFTKEQLIASAHARIEFAEMMLAGELEPLKERTWSIELELARIALASLEAVPVGTFKKGPCGYHPSFHEDAVPLYTAPPAPVYVPAAMEMDDDFDSSFEHGKAVGWNACRAAMLQSFGNSEQLNSPVIPDGWKLVPIDPTKDMLRAGQSVVGFWLNTVHCYSKMLAAAPAAPQQEVNP